MPETFSVNIMKALTDTAYNAFKEEATKLDNEGCPPTYEDMKNFKFLYDRAFSLRNNVRIVGDPELHVHYFNRLRDIERMMATIIISHNRQVCYYTAQLIIFRQAGYELN